MNLAGREFDASFRKASPVGRPELASETGLIALIGNPNDTHPQRFKKLSDISLPGLIIISELFAKVSRAEIFQSLFSKEKQSCCAYPVSIALATLPVYLSRTLKLLGVTFESNFW